MFKNTTVYRSFSNLKVVNEVALRVNEVRIEARRVRFSKIHYHNESSEHIKFLEMYQTIYPGELIGP